MTFLHSLLDMSPLRLQFPELLLLAIPLWVAFQRWGRAKGVTGGLRLALVLALLFVFAGPEMRRGGRGIDVIVVADLSRSMPTDAEGRIKELTVNLQKGRGPGDRVGLVTFGSKPEIEEILSRESILGEFKKEVLPDGSDLNAALHTALNLVQTSRPARILLFSDGEANGASPLSAARRAREMHVPIDYRAFERLRTGDAAIDSILLPETVAPREPFQFSVWIESDRETEGRVSVYREGEQIASSVRQLHAGSNQLLFRDLLESPGLIRYEVRLEVEGDPLKENNIGRGVVRVEGGPELLVLNADGKEDNLVRALRAGRVTTSVAAASQHPLTQESLVRYRAVILENVPASDLGRLKMERLVQFVEDLGGGLMLT
ncbi:MAG TPA: vWA domain-containing protein, partial [Planctomycetaceae bacterium]|nr:vWA domain-containing protein [Planctomycetaceae bacterium]